LIWNLRAPENWKGGKEKHQASGETGQAGTADRIGRLTDRARTLQGASRAVRSGRADDETKRARLILRAGFIDGATLVERRADNQKYSEQ
jgi:hypothetical protein